jgi:hypothetical protein
MPSLAPFGQAVSEEKIFLTLANQKKEIILVAMFVGQMERNGEIYRGPYIDAYCQVSPDPKGHVRYCHHLASIVRPLTFSYFNLLL